MAKRTLRHRKTRHLLDMAENNTPLCFAEKGILHLPDEILTQIILLLTPRERVPLGNSCRRLKTLVFEDRRMLRHLDFSIKAGLTNMTDIQPYFNNEKACRYILRVDARNVECVKPGDPLNNSIGRAINLVEVDIRGTKFDDICQLHSFLLPLRCLVKLSIDWLGSDIDYTGICRRLLRKPLWKLTYLSVRFDKALSSMFIGTLSLCKKLKELHMESLKSYPRETLRILWHMDIRKLTNLKIVHYNGEDASRIKEKLATVLPDPKQWTDFQYCAGAVPLEFYIEKDVEVCEELLQSKRLRYFLDPNHQGWDTTFKLKWALNPEHLLKEVLILTHEEVPEDFCCFTPLPHDRRNFLKVDEAKMLLKDPRYQISHLCLNHKVERDCDAHLLVSAFPNLSELVLHSVSRKQGTSPNDLHFQKRLRRRCGPVPEEHDDSPNLDSSFKMLVQNTPNLRHFRLDPDEHEVKDWDLDALCHISEWRNLETLHMEDVACEDGKFLIEIGKKCKNLQKLFLHNVRSRKASGDEVALFQMLEHCRNLRDVTVKGCYENQAGMFSSLARNAGLVRVETNENITCHSAAPWVSSMENLVRQCAKLNTIICEAKFRTEDDVDEAVAALERMKAEFRGRPDFQIQVTCFTDKPKPRRVQVGRVFEDLPPREIFNCDISVSA